MNTPGRRRAHGRGVLHASCGADSIDRRGRSGNVYDRRRPRQKQKKKPKKKKTKSILPSRWRQEEQKIWRMSSAAAPKSIWYVRQETASRRQRKVPGGRRCADALRVCDPSHWILMQVDGARLSFHVEILPTFFCLLPSSSRPSACCRPRWCSFTWLVTCTSVRRYRSSNLRDQPSSLKVPVFQTELFIRGSKFVGSRHSPLVAGTSSVAVLLRPFPPEALYGRTSSDSAPPRD